MHHFGKPQDCRADYHLEHCSHGESVRQEEGACQVLSLPPKCVPEHIHASEFCDGPGCVSTRTLIYEQLVPISTMGDCFPSGICADTLCYNTSESHQSSRCRLSVCKTTPHTQRKQTPGTQLA